MRQFLKIFDSFEKGVLIEHCVERTYFEIRNIPVDLQIVPRVVDINPTLRLPLKYLMRFARYFLWIVLICFLFFFLYKFSKYVLYLCTKPSKPSRYQAGNAIYFACGNAEPMLRLTNIPEYPRYILKSEKSFNDNKLQNVTDELIVSRRVSFFIAFKSLLIACFGLCFFVFKKSKAPLLYTYTLFDWLNCYFRLKHFSPGQIWITNHYDRWVALAFLVCPSNVKIVQHGSLHQLIRNKIFYVKLSPELKFSPSEMFVSDLTEVRYFQECFNLTSCKISPFLDSCNFQFVRGEQGSILVIEPARDFGFVRRFLRAAPTHVSENCTIFVKRHPLSLNNGAHYFGPAIEISPGADIPSCLFIVSYGGSLDQQLGRQLPQASFYKFDVDEARERGSSYLSELWDSICTDLSRAGINP